jgi:hypothetical protein
MAIDKSGKWWKGETFDDLAQYIRLLTEDGYGADRVLQCRCTCGGTVFRLAADRDEGCAERLCASCKSKAFIADSAEGWNEAKPKGVRRVCGSTDLELGVGFALRPDDEVKWITVGHRCTRCGVLASFVDWQIDYAPSKQLLEMA